MQIITKEVAVQYGLKRYFTGVPCRHGHIAERALSNGGCLKCNRDGVKRRRQMNACVEAVADPEDRPLVWTFPDQKSTSADDKRSYNEGRIDCLIEVFDFVASIRSENEDVLRIKAGMFDRMVEVRKWFNE